jgi:hypothetical protein
VIKILNHVGRESVRVFTLEKAQPVKDPLFMLFPVRGTLEVKAINGSPVAKKKITVRSYKELMKVMHQSAS